MIVLQRKKPALTSFDFHSSNLMTFLMLFFLFTFSTSHALKCIRQNEPLEQILINYKYEKFKKILNSLPNNTRVRCRVELSIYYGDSSMTIHFSKSLSMNNLSDHHVQLDTFVYHNIRMETQLTKYLVCICLFQSRQL
jgi:hypothetical protein